MIPKFYSTTLLSCIVVKELDVWEVSLSGGKTPILPCLKKGMVERRRVKF